MTMTTTSVDQLSRRFADVFSTGDTDGLFAPEVFFDLNMPTWRFQMAGPDAIEAQLAVLRRGPIEIDLVRTVATESGFVAEHEEHQLVDGDDLTARRLWLCETRDGLITEATCFCTGEWDATLRARQAAEAPMLRKWSW
jgi:ketosteroid isomerase-like protein